MILGCNRNIHFKRSKYSCHVPYTGNINSKMEVPNRFIHFEYSNIHTSVTFGVDGFVCNLSHTYGIVSPNCMSHLNRTRFGLLDFICNHIALQIRSKPTPLHLPLNQLQINLPNLLIAIDYLIMALHFVGAKSSFS